MHTEIHRYVEGPSLPYREHLWPVEKLRLLHGLQQRSFPITFLTPSPLPSQPLLYHLLNTFYREASTSDFFIWNVTSSNLIFHYLTLILKKSTTLIGYEVCLTGLWGSPTISKEIFFMSSNCLWFYPMETKKKLTFWVSVIDDLHIILINRCLKFLGMLEDKHWD